MGQPTLGEPGVPTPEYIGRAEGTGGTETSQYPEEKKIRSGNLLLRLPQVRRGGRLP